jgi:hypothetical protein
VSSFLPRTFRSSFWLSVLLVTAASAAGSSACSSSNAASDGGGGTTGGTCASALPENEAGATYCPGTAPSYQNDVLPILKTDCIPCHSPSGTAGYDESTYTDVYNQRSPILDQVNGCQMPPADGPPLSNAQRVVLLDWLVCGAPNN